MQGVRVIGNSKIAAAALLSLVLGACSPATQLNVPMTPSEEFKKSLFVEPKKALEPVPDKSDNSIRYDVYEIVDVTFAPDSKVASLSARATIKSSVGRETVDMVGVIRDDGSASLMDLTPLPSGLHRLVGEAYCVDRKVCKHIILNVFYNVGGKVHKRQFVTGELLAASDAGAKSETADPNEAHESEKTSPNAEDPLPQLAPFKGPETNKDLVDQLVPRGETPELVDADKPETIDPKTPAAPPTNASESAIDDETSGEDPHPPTTAPVEPAKPAPAKPAPGKPVPARPVPAKPAPAKPAPAKPEPVPVKPAPAKPAPAKPAPVAASTNTSAEDDDGPPDEPKLMPVPAATVTTAKPSPKAPPVATQPPKSAKQPPAAPPRLTTPPAPRASAPPAKTAPPKVTPVPLPAAPTWGDRLRGFRDWVLSPFTSEKPAPAKPPAAPANVPKPAPAPPAKPAPAKPAPAKPAPAKPAEAPVAVSRPPVRSGPAKPPAVEKPKPAPAAPPAAPAAPAAPATPTTPQAPEALRALPFPPSAPKTDTDAETTALMIKEAQLAPLLNLREGGIALRAPTEGGLRNASQLPASGEGFKGVLVTSNVKFGSGILISFIENAAAFLKRQFFPDLTIGVGDIAKERGGAYGSHNTHDNGLAADIGWIGVPDPLVYSAFQGSTGVVKKDFPFEKTWKMIELAYKQRIIYDGREQTALNLVYMSPAVKDAFCTWAKEKKITETEDGRQMLRSILRQNNHYKHFHLAMKCSPHYPATCRHFNDPEPGTGCK